MGEYIEPSALEGQQRAARLSKVGRNAGLAALACSGAFLGAWAYYDQAGDVTPYPSHAEGPSYIDNRVRVITWNMHNETAIRLKEISRLANSYDPDVIALQEVTSQDAERLAEHFSENWHTVFVIADAKRQFYRGVYGNVLMSRQEPSNIVSRKAEGSSLAQVPVGFMLGFSADVVRGDTSLARTKERIPEDRSAVAFTIKARNNNELIDVDVGTTHIAGIYSPVHSSQLDIARSFIEGINKRGNPFVVCGDFNSTRPEMKQEFTPKFDVPRTSATLVGSTAVLDYCVSNASSTSTAPRTYTRVLNEYQTDHMAVMHDMVFQESTIPPTKR